MRPFYYPLLVILAFAGLSTVAGNLISREQVHVCIRCGRVQQTISVTVFGVLFTERKEEEVTAFTRAWPGALLCMDHGWQQTDYTWRTVGGGGPQSRMPASVRRLLDDPEPVLLLQRVDPERAEGVLRALLQEEDNQGAYYIMRGSRAVRRPSVSEGATEELMERFREKPMSLEELRRWDRNNSEPPETPSGGN